MITCLSCGEVKELHCKNICQKCYNKQYRKLNINNRKLWDKNNRKERNKYHREHNYEIGKTKSMYKNKTCPLYLGVVIAEQVLEQVFKTVQKMPMHNPGYDFICGKGYLIDVKSATLREKRNYWGFGINKNKIADYFLCLAFDNRTDLNPEHIWLIPSDIVNDKTGIGISPSTINKWNEYKLDINKIIKCCNTLKGDIK